MPLHDDLLDLAIRLVGPPTPPTPTSGPGTPASSPAGAPTTPPTPAPTATPGPPATPLPSEAELRRAISTAYYALFHLLIDASITRGVATVPLRPYVARNFEHRQMLSICKRYTGLTTDMTGQPVPSEINRIANAFIQLQNARHQADYNIKDPVTSADAHAFVLMARVAFADWATVASNPAVDTYLTELLVGGIKDR